MTLQVTTEAGSPQMSQSLNCLFTRLQGCLTLLTTLQIREG